MPATFLKLLLLLPLPLSLACNAQAEPDKPAAVERAYAEHVRSALEHRPVSLPVVSPQRPDRWDTWLYMPWRYRWTIGTGEDGGRFARDHGINGGMTDHGKGPLEWLERWGLRFYNDHTAGKGALFLLPAPGRDEALRDPRAVRPRPLDDALKRELQATISGNVQAIRGSPLRVAYALDDEISWGVLARPAVWRINADDGAYQRWLDAFYGGAALKAQWVAPDHAFAQLDRPLADIDLSPLLDRLTYNDSVFANFVGGLVEHCQREDPATPCGFVGGQGPGAWGGYDWAKLARKVRFVEVYDLGSAQEILRSLAPDVPRVTTHFHRLGSPRVAVVNQTTIQTFFKNDNPIGESVIFNGDVWKIVGVIADVPDRKLDGAARIRVYCPYAFRTDDYSVVVRTSLAPMTLVSDVRAALQQLDPGLPIANPRALDEAMAESMTDRRLILGLIGAFAATALLLACVGLYGVMAYSVVLRRRELCIRLALGAAPRVVRTMVLRDGLRLALFGLAVGLVGAYAGARLISAMLFGVSAHDPAVLGSVALILAVGAVIACWIPALTASRSDPMNALRAE